MVAGISRRTILAGTALSAMGAAGVAAAPSASSAHAGSGHAQPLQMAYFRTWHDRAVDPARPNSIGDVPREVDVVCVFPDYTEDDSPFWATLRDQYVPALHARGQKVVRTADIRIVFDERFEDTAEGRRRNAEAIVAELVEEHGLDGLDIDMESALSPAQVERAAGVMAELGRLIGPASGTGRLFLYDTNRDGDEPLFARIAPFVDYVLVQSYGRPVSSLQKTWSTYAPHIEPHQYLIGFSFYEERDANRWNDTSEPFETSRAAAFADWQPEGARKGGIFSYAVDRDGVAFRDDEIRLTTYEWSRRLKARMVAGA